MSIIHDALKKVQQGQAAAKADETPVTSPAATPVASSPWSSQTGTATQADNLPIEHLPPSPKKANSFLALLCAILIISGALIFFYKQMNSYFPVLKNFTTSSINRLMSIIKKPDLKTNAPEHPAPLATIAVLPPKPLNAPKPPNPPSPTIASSPAKTPVPVNTPNLTAAPANIPNQNVPQTLNDTTVMANAPETLNIHGVMSNGANNVVLINDQVYQEGDDVDGIKIVKISLDNITVINNGKEEKIRVDN